MESPTPSKPVFEHHYSGLGVNNTRPRISWRFQTTAATVPGWAQSSYELEITFVASGQTQRYRVASDQSVLVPWPTHSLASRERATVRVRVYGESLGSPSYNSDEAGPWSPDATVETALLNRSDFYGQFITSAQRFGDGPLQPIRFRKDFVIPADYQPGCEARLYITALGVFETWINGRPVTDECLAPGWTSYKHRLGYRVLDTTNLLVPGQTNTICVEVAEGWYAGRLGFKGGIRFRYGDVLGVMAQLEIRQRAPRVVAEPWMLLSDDTWTAAPSALLGSELYDGEIYDLREEQTGWALPDTIWPESHRHAVKTLPWPSARLFASESPPVRVTEAKACTKAFRSESGKTLLDFGQNLVGKLSVKSLTLAKGARVTFKHAEVLENGELGTRPLRDAKCCDTIIGSGETLLDWTPKFTFHGFRYVQVDGWPGGGLPELHDFRALVIHTDMKRRGFFECSNKHVNQLHRNVVWSMRGNFVSIPTDCPQRDERLGWTGDLQVFCPTASFLYDTVGILGSWLEDVAVEQMEDGKGGIPPLVVPLAISPNWPHIAQAVWDDVTVLTPDVLYKYSGDKGLLERQFESMHTWLDEGVDRASDGLWNPDKWQLGDWLDPSAPPNDPGNGRTDNILVANAYLVHTTLVFSHLCAILGKADMAAKYASDGDVLKALFQRRYITPDGNLMSSSQTGLSLAVQFGLYPDDPAQRRAAAQALDRQVRTARFRIGTGFAGTPVIAHALTSIGRPQLAYRMLLETECPSWLYPVVAMGATTVWERWDSMLPNGRINPGQMTSFNHYALGAVADWLHSSVGGISPLEPGWRVIRVRPVPGGNITSASVRFEGPYGLVACTWALDGDVFSMQLTVPPSCSAVITLPSDLRRDYECVEEASHTAKSGVHHFECIFKAGEWPPKPFIAANQPMPPDTIAE